MFFIFHTSRCSPITKSIKVTCVYVSLPLQPPTNLTYSFPPSSMSPYMYLLHFSSFILVVFVPSERGSFLAKSLTSSFNWAPWDLSCLWQNWHYMLPALSTVVIKMFFFFFFSFLLFSVFPPSPVWGKLISYLFPLVSFLRKASEKL